MVNVITEILDTVINHHITIEDFNIGILTVIIKDAKGPTDSLYNIRPITLSNVIDIVFETYLNHFLNQAIENHEVQFGFSHANLILDKVKKF